MKTTCLALVLSILPAAAGAQTATLVMADLCEDPSAAFDWEWSRVKHGSAALYFMKADGSVAAITDTPAAFDGFPTLYIAAHGGQDVIDGFNHDTFAANLKAAHPATPTEVFFAVCGSGAGPDSLLKKTNAQYADAIRKLSGGVTGCALVGNGSTDLANADYLIDVTHSDDQLYQDIIDNIEQKWSGPYPASVQSYAEVCNVRTDPFDRASVEDFVNTVLQEFSQPAPQGHPEESTNYLDLVAVNDGGNPLTICGADPAGGGAVPCP
ncbi:hypothetical protein [Polymorphum gilvum]|uniref:Uncharacterized protein n=1 Tax=Polymorphum gilvum (strain LMG 25793 / CGMCC 1.9160 / SL003B-26A1) TaxID=991905 RepID=F2IVV9_POLGS|nr:hypothetical protein [Polymorphum gilvum]ADZ69216.1 hypothetical protein SL003B_0786 [Polymorphum gilvum SL003B-26A1]